MKIQKSLIERALNDIDSNATIDGVQLGDEEYVTLLNFTEPPDALRFMASLALRLREIDSHIGVLASVAAVETVSRKGRTTVRFRGWQLVTEAGKAS